MELLLWASYRGQLLSRTVRGMMAYERGVRLLAQLEHPQPLGLGDAEYLAQVDDLCRSKFSYVVASQVGGARVGAGEGGVGAWVIVKYFSQQDDLCKSKFGYIMASQAGQCGV